MKWQEIEEAATQVWSRQGTKNVRKYRCTTGPRKGRTVSKPSTCTAPKNTKASVTLSKTKKAVAGKIRKKTSVAKRLNPASVKLSRLNKRRKSLKRKSSRRKKI